MSNRFLVVIRSIIFIFAGVAILVLIMKTRDNEESIRLEPIETESTVDLPAIVITPTVIIPPLTAYMLTKEEVGDEEEDFLFAAWQHIRPEGIRIVDISVFYVALSKTEFPQFLWYRLWTISSLCEAPTTQSPAIGPERAAVDVFAIGDNGLAIGAFMIRVDHHPEQAAKYNLLSLEENALAAYEVYAEAGNSLGPWSCNTKLFPNG